MIEARYGTVRGMSSWNPVSAVFTPWLELVRLSVRSRSVAELREVWIGTPEDLNARLSREDGHERQRFAVRWG